MELIEEAFRKLYPDKEFKLNGILNYSGRFSDYNANGRFNKYNNTIEINLSKKWRKIDKDIQIGMIQALMLKLFKDRVDSFYVDLYNNFIRNLHIAVPKDNIDPTLEKSFERMNDLYFYGQIEKPNLEFGTKSFAKLGSYNYKTDTISISTIFKNNEELMDFVMYHEILHKKHKFKGTIKTYHHTAAFKREERAFEDFDGMENKLRKFARNQRIKSFIFD